MFNPRFKSAAAMAGWDEDSLLMASLIVDDTPEQDIKSKKRSVFRSKTPPTNSSRRKRRAQRKSPISIPVAVLDLDSEEATKEESVKENINEEDEKMDKSSGASGSSSKLPCMDKLRDELSCAVRASFCNVMGLCTLGRFAWRFALNRVPLLGVDTVSVRNACDRLRINVGGDGEGAFDEAEDAGDVGEEVGVGERSKKMKGQGYFGHLSHIGIKI